MFAVQADVMALLSTSRLTAALAPAAYHPTDAAVRKLWTQCESILDRGNEVPPYAAFVPLTLPWSGFGCKAT